MRPLLASTACACVGQGAGIGGSSAASGLHASRATCRDALLASADDARGISSGYLCRRPSVLRVYRLAVVIDLRLEGPLVLFAVGAMARALCSERDGSASSATGLHRNIREPLRNAQSWLLHEVLPSREQLALRWRFNRLRTFRVVVRGLIDSHAHWVAPHHSRVVGPQHLRHRSYIPECRIEPRRAGMEMGSGWRSHRTRRFRAAAWRPNWIGNARR